MNGRRFHVSDGLLGFAILLPLGLFALAAWQSYGAAIELATARVERTARILEEHALKVFETQRLVIDATNERLQAKADNGAGGGALQFHLFLKRLAADLPQVGTITVVRADGHLLASSRSYPPDATISFADRDWFETLRAKPVTQPIVSKSYLGRQSGLPVFNVADRVKTPADAAFAGAIAISVDRTYFESFYRTTEIGVDHSILLVRDDGEILAADPSVRASVLSRTSTLLTAIRQSPTGTYRARSVLDGVDRYFAYRKIGLFPVFVRVGIAREAALATWRANLGSYGFVAASASLCLLGAGWMARRQSERWRITAAALENEAKQRERAESDLRQAQKMEAVGQLTGGIAHDFNNMLSVIIGALNLAQRRLARGDTAIDRYLDAATEGATRAAGLTRRLLAFSRQQPLQPEPLILNQLVAGMADLLHRTIGETVRLETELATDLWPVTIDASALENAILNLAVNARDAMPRGGRLTIATGNATLAPGSDDGTVAGDFVLLSVTDSGTGMSEEVLQHAFEPFFTTKEVGKGTGLGLSQTYGFVKQSGGQLRVESTVGRGSSFKIYLPRLVSTPSTALIAAPAEKSPLPDAGQAKGRPDEVILVVEDDSRVRSISVAALREIGFGVVEAADGEAALAVLRGGAAVSLVFTDVVMPGMSGHDLATIIARNRPDLKVLFATGYSRHPSLQSGTSERDVQLIAKPFTVEQLASRIRAILDEPSQRARGTAAVPAS